jgi:Tfp pilus assembly protein PilZ
MEINRNKLIAGQSFVWTKHAENKMRQYGLSVQRVKRIANHPSRLEEGIAPGTVAGMQPAGTSRKRHEIWVMFQESERNGERKKKIISAWRYPGITRPGRPLPWEIISEIQEAIETEEI